MVKPTRRDAAIDHLLSNFSIAFDQDMRNTPFSWARDLWTPQTAKTQKFRYPVFNKGDLTRVEMKPRGEWEEAAVGGYGLTYEEATCQRAALKKPQPREIVEEFYESGLDADRDDAAYLTQQSYLFREVTLANAFMAINKWTAQADQQGVAAGPTGAQFLKFSNTSSVPIPVINQMCLAVRAGCGKLPNRMAMDADTWLTLISHASILARLGNAQNATLPVLHQLLGAIWGIEQVHVLAASVNTSNEGQDEVLENVAGNFLWVGYVAPKGGPRVYTAGGYYSYDKFDMFKDGGVAIKRIARPELDGFELETEQYGIPVIQASDAGAFAYDTI